MTAPRRKRARTASSSPKRGRRGRATDSAAAQFNVVRELLDHELIDAQGLPCGVVDDVMLDGAPGRPLHVVALLVGPGAWLRRLPAWAGWLARRVAGTAQVRVPWSAIAHVGERIELSGRASELGLGGADRRVGRWIARIPGGRRAPE